jgi:hypothetical protein
MCFLFQTDLNITLKFVVGWPSDKDNFDMLLEEFLQLNDLILYDIEDSYANLYLKVTSLTDSSIPSFAISGVHRTPMAARLLPQLAISAQNGRRHGCGFGATQVVD